MPMLMTPRVSRREWRCAKWEGGRERERLGGEGEGLVGRGDGMAKMGCVWNRGQTWFQTNLEPFGTVWNRLEPFGTASVGMAMAMVRRESVGKGVRRPRGEVRKRTGGVWAGGERRGEEK